MCRPSCCDNSGGQGAGIAAVAIILGAALIVAKIGAIVAQIARIALEVIRSAALTAGAVLAVAVAAWLAVSIVRWWLRQRGARRQAIPQPVNGAAWRQMATSDGSGCLACGGSGQVLRAIDGVGSRYQPGACPVCEPAEWAG
jgi:hypothetical protein